MKSIILSLSLALPLTAFASPLANFNDIEQAIEQGKRITIFTDLNTCTPSKNIKASYTPSAMMMRDHEILFSSMHMGAAKSDHSLSPIPEYIHYRLSDDNQVTLEAYQFDIQNKKWQLKHSFHCGLGRGVLVNGTN